VVGVRSSEGHSGRRRRARRVFLVAGTVVFLAAAAGVAFAVVRGASVAGDAGPNPRTPVRAFATAWAASDFRTMYRQLTPSARRHTPFTAFQAAYQQDATTGTLRGVSVKAPLRVVAGEATIPIILRTRLFGRLHEQLTLHLVRGSSRYQISWGPQLAWPGLLPGETLARTTRAPKTRGKILADDRTVLAQGFGANRVYPQGAPFYEVTGFLRAPQTAADRRRRVAQGWPAGSLYGQGGLEESLNGILGGMPSMHLVAQSSAGDRVLGRHAGRHPRNVVTTLDPALQSAATDALTGKYGGIVIMDPRDGAIQAAAGIAMDARQPPGSTFKMVTASAALTAGVVTPDTYFTPAHYVDIGGFRLRNFHHELCGGTLVESFANSCNSVFAPVAIKTGGKRLVAMADGYGFNARSTTDYPVVRSLTPGADELKNIVDLGVAGIGQGGVAATPLQMASVGQTIAEGGVMRSPWIVRRPRSSTDRTHKHRVISRGVAADVGEMMRAVVAYGTGTLAASPLATVNGKTGTAELGPGIKTDAWFVGYAPAEAPRVVVSVLVVHGGVGGQTAAPIARDMIDAALQ
jgi:beta-lactamase class D